MGVNARDLEDIIYSIFADQQGNSGCMDWVCDPEELIENLADEGYTIIRNATYEIGDNGWDEETNSPVHYPVEPECRDDDHYCPDPAPPRYRRVVGPWEEIG